MIETCVHIDGKNISKERQKTRHQHSRHTMSLSQTTSEGQVKFSFYDVFYRTTVTPQAYDNEAVDLVCIDIGTLP